MKAEIIILILLHVNLCNINFYNFILHQIMIYHSFKIFPKMNKKITKNILRFRIRDSIFCFSQIIDILMEVIMLTTVMFVLLYFMKIYVT